MKGGRARSEAGLQTKCPHLTPNNYKTRLRDKGPAPGVLAVFVLVSLIPVLRLHFDCRYALLGLHGLCFLLNISWLAGH